MDKRRIVIGIGICAAALAIGWFGLVGELLGFLGLVALCIVFVVGCRFLAGLIAGGR